MRVLVGFAGFLGGGVRSLAGGRLGWRVGFLRGLGGGVGTFGRLRTFGGALAGFLAGLRTLLGFGLAGLTRVLAGGEWALLRGVSLRAGNGARATLRATDLRPLALLTGVGFRLLDV